MKKTLSASVALFIVFVAAIFNINLSQAQDIRASKLTWKVIRLDDTASKESMDYTAEFITYTDQRKITWNQQNGAHVSDFKITGMEGDWKDIGVEGKVEFTVEYYGKNGKLWIGREGDKLEVRLFFMEDSTNRMPYVFHVSSVTKS